jgi:hypothetical protein
MPRNVLLILIVIVALLVGWFAFEEVQRSRALEAQANELLARPLGPDTAEADRTEATSSGGSAPASEPSTPTAATPLTNELLSGAIPDVETIGGENVENTNANASTENTSSASSANAPSQNPAPTSPETCSSFDEAGLLAAFDGALSSFLANATATYGTQYQGLHYQLSSKNATITAEQGTVTASYTGTVQELSTGEDVSANGTLSATFAWDSCTWQLLDYSF